MKLISMPKIVIRDSELTRADKYTFLVLSNFYNVKNNNAFPSLHKMVEVGGLSEAQYCRGLQKLQSKQLINITKLPGKTYKRNHYTFKAAIMEEFIQVTPELLSYRPSAGYFP